MDEKTTTLISLGASTVANCIPCFEHYFGKAGKLGISLEEINEAVDVAMQVKHGPR